MSYDPVRAAAYRKLHRERIKQNRDRYRRSPEGSAKERAYREQYYRANQERSRDHARRYRERNRRFVRRVKGLLSCAACGSRFHYSAMDFHHLIPSEKSRNVSQLAAKNVRIARIKAEMRKCVLVCANCHRVFEFSQTTDDPEV